MLPPEYLEQLADELMELYGALDEAIARDVARRLAKAGGVTWTAGWQLRCAQQAGLLYEDVVAEVAKITDASEAQVKALFEDAGVEALRWDADIYEAAGLSPPPLRQSPAALQRLAAGLKKTNGQLRNLTLTTASQAQQAYIQAATLAEMKIESGAFSYQQAVRDAVKQAAGGGAWVQYPSGHRDRLDVAVRRAVLTGVNQTAAEISLGYADDMGCDLVETTAHPGARPEHMVWQGKVFSRSGGSRKYPDFVSSTGYGAGPGLCGYNCRHSFHPFFEGLSDRAYPREKLREYEDKTVVYNGEEIPYYDATQKQRAMERGVRASKRELAALDEAAGAAGDPALRGQLENDFAAASVTLKRREAALRDFVRQTGLQKDGARVQVVGFGRSRAARVIWAVKKNTLTNAAGQEIIRVTRVTPTGYPNSITQRENAKGGIDRNYYGPDGRQIKQISNNDHGHKAERDLGLHGEHAHDYIWDVDGKMHHGLARELDAQEREENKDFL